VCGKALLNPPYELPRIIVIYVLEFVFAILSYVGDLSRRRIPDAFPHTENRPLYKLCRNMFLDGNGLRNFPSTRMILTGGTVCSQKALLLFSLMGGRGIVSLFIILVRYGNNVI